MDNPRNIFQRFWLEYTDHKVIIRDILVSCFYSELLRRLKPKSGIIPRVTVHNHKGVSL